MAASRIDVVGPNICEHKMRAGQARRIPQDAARGLVGFYLACPYCGGLNCLLAGDANLVLAEKAGSLVTVDGVTCRVCKRAIRADGGFFVG